MMRRSLWMLAFFVVLCSMPSPARACDERCIAVYDVHGRQIGHGCVSGSDGENCEATVEDCEIDYCGAPLTVVTGMGTPAELSGICPASSANEEEPGTLLEDAAAAGVLRGRPSELSLASGNG